MLLSTNLHKFVVPKTKITTHSAMFNVYEGATNNEMKTDNMQLPW